MKSLNKSKVLYTATILAFANSAYAANADVSFYGEIDVSVASTKSE